MAAQGAEVAAVVGAASDELAEGMEALAEPEVEAGKAELQGATLLVLLLLLQAYLPASYRPPQH